MERDLILPDDRHRRLRPNGLPARLVLADPNRTVADLLRLHFVWHGFGEPHMTEDAEETLDLLGAIAQNVDLMLVAFGNQRESVDVRLIEVLRNIRSPVRLACYGGLSPEDLPRLSRDLSGIAAYIDLAGTYGIARWTRDLIDASVSVRDIYATRRVPQTLSRRWAQAIYGAAPGEIFSLGGRTTLN